MNATAKTSRNPTQVGTWQPLHAASSQRGRPLDLDYIARRFDGLREKQTKRLRLSSRTPQNFKRDLGNLVRRIVAARLVGA